LPDTFLGFGLGILPGWEKANRYVRLGKSTGSNGGHGRTPADKHFPD